VALLGAVDGGASDTEQVGEFGGAVLTGLQQADQMCFLPGVELGLLAAQPTLGRRGGSGSGRSRYQYDTPITWRKAIAEQDSVSVGAEKHNRPAGALGKVIPFSGPNIVFNGGQGHTAPRSANGGRP